MNLWGLQSISHHSTPALLGGGKISPFVPLFGIDRPGIGGPWYHLVMTNALPWKDPPFLSSVNHLFLWAIYTMAMLNNQRIDSIGFCIASRKLLAGTTKKIDTGTRKPKLCSVSGAYMFSWAKSEHSYLHRFAQKQNISTNEHTRYFVENYPIWSNFQICSSNWRWKSNDQWYLSDCNGSIIRGCDFPLFPTVCHIAPPYLKQKRVRKSWSPKAIGCDWMIMFNNFPNSNSHLEIYPLVN